MKDKEFELMFEELLKEAFKSKPREIDYCFTPASYDLFIEQIAQEAKREGFITIDPDFIQPLNPPVELEAVLYYDVKEYIELFKDYLTEEMINTLRDSGEPIKVEIK